MTSPGSRWSQLDRPPLGERALRAALIRPDSLWTRLDVLESTGSTNVDLIAAVRAGRAGPGTVLIAEEQTSGRGRLGRTWSAPPRSGLFFSVLLQPAPEVPADRLTWLPLLAGVATAAAVARAAGVDTALKWPNDLLVTVDAEERKCGGILAERAEGGMVVLGIGLNVSLRADELPVPGAGSLLLAGAVSTDRDPLLRACLRSLADWYTRWTRAGGDPEAAGLLDTYAAGCATLGRRVRAELPGDEELHGTAEALDGEGRLVIAADDGTRHPLTAADIIHLRAT
ncbi:biotin--[acetyl-CoA-carboxylase] ligase [Streptomyces litchfieldiae]|uniref:biotin--[biotin carboxyl-carrier protein] ligase n=1 Tax=Streptomyces litchfieldiae TaxID=3075543 RepID=A0ABU2MLA4_9ACTN|nr:biotin--[acetyl-CoA-carboxylase] ligase [Streptomyces sp. DSM 44938]MDT0342310.1 biotin--[acetyl-CoA-carboxylase] ligase [Streptomyces sp. DSM 44938]